MMIVQRNRWLRRANNVAKLALLTCFSAACTAGIDESGDTAARSEPAAGDFAALEQTLETSSGEGDVTAQATASFLNSCYGTFVGWYYGNILSASADYCRRRDGTFGPFTWWAPPVGSVTPCKTDIANCDGTLRCGSC